MRTIILASFLAKAGLGSRRSTIPFIESGDISVNGKVTRELRTLVDPEKDKIHYKDRLLTVRRHRYLLLHKPPGYICSSQDHYADKLVFELIKSAVGDRLFTVGRLDKNSEGLLLLTNDGDWALKLTHPRYEVEKTYKVMVTGDVRADHMKKLVAGISDQGQVLKAEKAVFTGRRPDGATLRIVVKEGRKREIRRMCRYFNYQVNRLIRTQIGPLKLGQFQPGFSRELTPKEVESLGKIDSLDPNVTKLRKYDKQRGSRRTPLRRKNT